MRALRGRLKLSVSMAAALAFAAGCVDSSKSIEAQYVSDLQYASLSCEAIEGEMQRVASRVSVVSGQQDEAAEGDAAVMGIGLILFWPALFALAASDDQAGELSRLKGEYEALHRAGLKKECGLDPDSVLASARGEGPPAASDLGAAVAQTSDWRLTLVGVSGLGLRACGRDRENSVRFTKVPYAEAKGSLDLGAGESGRYNVKTIGPEKVEVTLRLFSPSGADIRETLTLTKDMGQARYAGDFNGVSNEAYGSAGGCAMRVTLTPLATS